MMYIGLDVGTSGCKAAVIDEKGKTYSTASREYSFEFPASGYVELNPSTVWRAVKEVLCEIAPNAQNAKAIAVSSIGESMVILDKYENPIANGIIYLDQRCKGITNNIIDKISKKELFEITGVPLNQMFTLSKFLWFRENNAEVLEKGEKFFLFGDYITYRISGKRYIDSGSASRTMFFDANKLEWSKIIAEKFDIPIEKFSKIATVGTKLGALLPEIVKETGLPFDMIVVLGCHDQTAASLGSGAFNAGDSTLGEGTSESLNLIVNRSDVTTNILESGFGYEPYLSPDLYMIPVGQSSHGICIRWFVNMFREEYEAIAKGEKKIYSLADDLCAESSDGLFFLPYLTRASATDTNNNTLGGFIGMELTTNRDKMYRALLEGLSFETRALIELLSSYGLEMKAIVATGGGSKSSLFMQLKADVLQKPIRVLNNAESGIVGLSMICAVACGEYASYKEAIEQVVTHKACYKPTADYEKKYTDYKMVVKAIKQLYNGL